MIGGGSGLACGCRIRFGQVGISLASTLIVKGLLPKLMEVIGTGSGTPAYRSRLYAILLLLSQLERDTTLALAEIPTDSRFRQAIRDAGSNPGPSTIDALTVTAVQYSHLRSGFAGVVDACHLAIIDNLREGGPILVPALWQRGYFIIEAPMVRRSGFDTVTVILAGRTFTLVVAPTAFAAGDAWQPIIAALCSGLDNAPPPPPISSGGGGAPPAPPAPPPPPPPPLTPAPIVFVSNETNANNDVFRINRDGTGKTQLTQDASADIRPVISPDGTRIAFLKTTLGATNLCVINANGTGFQQLALASPVTLTGSPSWSNDGTRIAYVSNQAGIDHISVYDLATPGSTQLTNNPAGEHSPRWSPNGLWIAFVSTRSGSGDIYRIKPDGTGEVQVTTDAQPDLQPCWSPDSVWISFVNKRDGHDNIFRIRANGTGEMHVTTGPGQNRSPVCSPDGVKTVYVSDRDGNEEIYVVDAGGISPFGTGGETRLTNNAVADNRPCWTADSTMIVFVSMRNGTLDIFRMNADGTNQTAVTTGLPAESDPQAR